MTYEQKSFDHHNIRRKEQNPTYLHDENPRESRTKGNIHQHKEGYIWKTLSQHHPIWRETEAILLKSDAWQGYPLSLVLFNVVMKALAGAIKQEKECKGI